MIKIRAGEYFCIVTADDKSDPKLVAQMIQAEYYVKGDLCFNEVMETIDLIGCSMAHTLKIIAACMDLIDGDKLVRVNLNDNVNETY